MQESLSMCRCGCNKPVVLGRKFLPGHDQRALHQVIQERYGDVAGFLDAHSYTGKSQEVTSK
jgi:hypothetical protein